MFNNNSANVASGDGSIAAGDDVYVDNSSFEMNIGDVSIGNTIDSYNAKIDAKVDNSDTWVTKINDSFNDTYSYEDNSNNLDVDVDVDDSNVGSPFGDVVDF